MDESSVPSGVFALPVEICNKGKAFKGQFATDCFGGFGFVQIIKNTKYSRAAATHEGAKGTFLHHSFFDLCNLRMSRDCNCLQYITKILAQCFLVFFLHTGNHIINVRVWCILI